jgi:GNAT superfamily N-acetyltransferase
MAVFAPLRPIAQHDQPPQYPSMERESLHIRHAGRNDLSGLLDLYQHLAPGDVRPTPDRAAEVFDQFAAYGGSAIFVGEISGVLAASCSLVVVPNLTRGGSPYGLIENVVTHSDFRNRGFGKQLLLAASDAAWRVGCYKVMLMTGSKKPETVNFYLGAGFEQSKTGFQKRRIPARAES